MLRSLLIIAALALSTGACTIHRHYHQAPEGAYAQAPELASRQPVPETQDPDQPIPPEYARPGFDDGYQSDDDGDDRYDNYDSYDGSDRYERYEHRCKCDHQRPAPRRSAPLYRRHLGPVVPDNPVEWLE